MKKILATMTLGVALVLVPAAAGAAPVTGGAGAAYGEHVSDHVRAGDYFSGAMNPGNHRVSAAMRFCA